LVSRNDRLDESRWIRCFLDMNQIFHEWMPTP
jgi:hypothetical protein